MLGDFNPKIASARTEELSALWSVPLQSKPPSPYLEASLSQLNFLKVLSTTLNWLSLPLGPRVEGGVIDMSFITGGSAFHCTFGDSRDPILC